MNRERSPGKTGTTILTLAETAVVCPPPKNGFAILEALVYVPFPRRATYDRGKPFVAENVPADKRGATQNKWNTHDTVFFLFLDCFLVQRWVPRFEDPSRDEPKQALLTYFQLVEFW